MAIPKETIEEIRSRNNIVEVISSYVPDLRRRGSTFKCCCPFHKEKTPSFTVNEERQVFKCFGCGIGGDVFKFVQEYDKVDFIGAIQILADRVGIEVVDDNKRAEKTGGKEVLLKLHADAAAYYHQNLLKGKDGEACRRYLNERDLPEEMIKDFQVGYASDDWEGLYSRAKKKGYSNEDMKKAGLVTEKKKCYDRFRNRLMFPICDSIGRVIGFSGRVIDKGEKSAKYVNSPETLIFHKGNVLFAFDKARKEIVEKRQVVVVEGQIDAMRCHQAGLNNVVASQGTALTEQHARLIKRYADEVILVFDADNAGVKAALSTSELFISHELIVRVAILPQKEDPDTLIRKSGTKALKELLDTAPSALHYLIKIMEERENQNTEVGRKRLIDSVIKLINLCPLATWKRQMLKQAAEYLHISVNDLTKDAKKIPTKKIEKEEQPKILGKKGDYNLQELRIISLLINHYDEGIDLVKKYFLSQFFSDPTCKNLHEKLISNRPEDLRKNLQDLSKLEEECFTLADLTEKRVDEGEGEQAVQNYIKDYWISVLKELKEKANLEEQFQINLDINKLKSSWNKAKEVIESRLQDV